MRQIKLIGKKRLKQKNNTLDKNKHVEPFNKNIHKIGKPVMKPVIFHNPKCGTSRNTLAIMQASGETPEVIEYLKNPPTRDYLVELLEKMQLMRQLLY